MRLRKSSSSSSVYSRWLYCSAGFGFALFPVPENPPPLSRCSHVLTQAFQSFMGWLPTRHPFEA